MPSTREQQRIPFARVNHAKYMVTDRVVYIGMLAVYMHNFSPACFSILLQSDGRFHHKNLPTETVHVYILKHCEYELCNKVNVIFIILLQWSIVILCFTGTSNWSENYFTQTAGVGLVVNQTGSAVGQGQQTVQSQLQKIFQRDWHSEYAQPITDVHAEHCSGKKLT